VWPESLAYENPLVAVSSNGKYKFGFEDKQGNSLNDEKKNVLRFDPDLVAKVQYAVSKD